MDNFKYNILFLYAVILLCALEKCFPYSIFKELTLQKKIILIKQNAVSIAPSLVPPRFQKHHYY